MVQTEKENLKDNPERAQLGFLHVLKRNANEFYTLLQIQCKYVIIMLTYKNQKFLLFLI